MPTDETKRKIADGVRKYHKEHPRTKETRAKLSMAEKTRHATGKSGGFKAHNKAGTMRTKEGRLRAHEACMKAVIGSHGFGCMEKGKPDHLFALHWVIQDPDGERYTFDNLDEWCRQNEHLFDPSPTAKTPLWKLASKGLAGKRKWKGWVTISSTPNIKSEGELE